jgi:RNA polymerase primary sigma factor
MTESLIRDQLGTPPQPRRGSAPKLRRAQADLRRGSDEGIGWLIRRAGHPILDHEDVLELGRRIQRGIQAASSLSDLCPHQDRTQLEKLIVDGDSAKRDLVLHNLRLVIDISRHFVGRGLPMEDLVQEGYFGLVRAAEKFDPGRDLRFSTYATWWIRQSIYRAIANLGSIIRLPVHVHDMVNRVTNVRDRIVLEKGYASRDEICDQTGLSYDEVSFALHMARHTTSLDSPVGDGLMTIGDLLVGEDGESISEMIDGVDTSRALRRGLGHLDERSARIIALRFGLDGTEPMTLEEVGNEFGLTRERIRQIEHHALEVLRGVLRDPARDLVNGPLPSACT